MYVVEKKTLFASHLQISFGPSRKKKIDFRYLKINHNTADDDAQMYFFWHVPTSI